MWLKRLRQNIKAITSGEAIGLAVSFFLVAILGPIAIDTIFNATYYNQTENWPVPVLTVFQIVLPVVWAVGIGVRYLPGRE